jgi:hypothetical protein
LQTTPDLIFVQTQLMVGQCLADPRSDVLARVVRLLAATSAQSSPEHIANAGALSPQYRQFDADSFERKASPKLSHAAVFSGFF